MQSCLKFFGKIENDEAIENSKFKNEQFSIFFSHELGERQKSPISQL